MNQAAKKVQKTYVYLTLFATFSNSFIWGINTLFLLDAGLSNTQAFAANAFFTIGQVIFEIPTGVVADAWGRRTSYLLGAATLFATTLGYLYLWNIEGPFWAWALMSALLGLGFTFFSGAVEAWLVDALDFTKYKGNLESVMAKGQVTAGIAMLSGSVAGGFIAQATNLGVPYFLRSAFLVLTFIVAYVMMKDLGFTPDKSTKTSKQIKTIWRNSLKYGIKNRPVRWMMLAAPFSAGVGFFAFYAMQPYLLELYGDPTAYGIAGLAAAVVAGAQVVGGLLVPWIRKHFNKRSSILILVSIISVVVLAVIGLTDSFWIAVAMLVLWALGFAATMPVRSALINALIPSKQRATVLSFDALMGSSGAVFTQPALGKVADVYSYSTAYLITSVVQLGTIPFMLLLKSEKLDEDTIQADPKT